MKNIAEVLSGINQQNDREWGKNVRLADASRDNSVQRIQSGEVLRFVYHENSDREPVERILFLAEAMGQQDLGLFTEPTIWIKK